MNHVGSRPAGLYFSHPASLQHDPRAYSPGHPDTPERLVALEAAFAQREWLGLERRLAPAATDEQLQLVHSSAHVERIRRLCESGGGMVDPDTFVGEPSFRAAAHAAGGACALAAALLAGDASLGFCAVRPSGHHAEPQRAMGFCLFNNVAIAAAFAIAELGLERVLIVDWDVHHGNGTAEAFRHRADVLFASIHQSPLYPGTGPLSDGGSGAGEGYTINLPVPPGSEEDLWLSLIEYVVLPVAVQFAPQLVLISAGFDAHREDPLANCRLQDGSFAQMAALVRDFAADRGIPVGVVLEGGYNHAVLARCAVIALEAFAGEGRSPSREPEPLLTPRARAQVGRYWSL